MTATQERHTRTTIEVPTGAFEVARVRADFPILEREVKGKPVAYLDNAASAQRPRAVLAAIDDCYSRYYANVHRGVHTLSQEATDAYERAREAVARFLGASSPREVVFLRGTTEAINLVAQSWGRRHVEAGDEVLLTEMEHHSNIVPWQLLCDEVGARLRVLPVTDDGALDLDRLDGLLGERTRLLAVTHVSNVLGTVNPIRQLVEHAHSRGVPVLVDGAQAAPHLPVDVRELGCDFYAFSGHKAFGPSGIGALWAREELLDAMPPWQGGGEMISRVSFERSDFADLPFKFEAGTPNIAGAIGLAAAIHYLEGLDRAAIERHERALLEGASEGLSKVGGVNLQGTVVGKTAVVSFTVDGVHPHDLGTLLDEEGVEVRAGHHCAQPLMQRFGVPATVRASFAFYNTLEEVDRLVTGVERARSFFRGE